MHCLKLVSSLLLLALAGCAHRDPDTPPKLDTITVLVPVATGCIAPSGRPAPVIPLKERYTEEWQAMPPGAKASAVQAQAGDRLNYEDALRAATSGCN